jgi:outer membrane protein assembly factor BamB
MTLARTLLVVPLAAGLAAGAAADDWPQWRGPELNGTSKETGLPVKWTPSENVAWKLAMPAWSGSTPIIWKDRVFLNVAEGDNLELWCVDRAKGELLWKRPLGGGNVKLRKQNMSSPSPVTDGQTVWVMTGTGVFKAFDYSGKELWAREIQKDYGAFGLNWGYASSPLLHDGALFVQVLHGMKTDDPSYVLRIDPKTGKTLWKVERPTAAIHESPDSYTTPLMVRRGKELELVVTGGDCVTGHDPATGKELWRANGLNPGNNPANRIIASPVAIGEVVIAPTRVKPMLAIKTGGRGDVTESHKVFSYDNGPDVPTPVSDGQHLYIVNDKGVVYCLDAKTGKEVYGQQRLKTGTYSSSPILADGKIYVTSEEGVTSVFKTGPQFEVLAENAMDDYVLSSVAISDGQIFLRTAQFLYVIGKRK